MDDAPHEVLPHRVLAHLDVEADGLLNHPIDRPMAATGQGASHPRLALDAAGGKCRHHVVPMALQQRHHGLHLPERLSLLRRHQKEQHTETMRPATGRLLPSSPDRLDQLPAVEFDGCQVPVDHAPEVGPKPRHSAELDPVSDFVQAQPQPELARIEPVSHFQFGDVRSDEVQEILALRRHEEVVLTEHFPTHVPEKAADLRGKRLPPHGGECSVAGSLGKSLREGRQNAFEPLKVQPDPSRAGHHP